MPKIGDLKWVMFQFPSNTRLCEAIHILLVIKLLLGVNYHHHAPPLLLYRLRSEVHPTAHPLQNTRTYNTVAGIAIFLTSKLFTYWDNKQQSQAQSDQCKKQMAFRLARWRWDFLGTAWSNARVANPPEGDTKPPGGNNPWNLLFILSIIFT